MSEIFNRNVKLPVGCGKCGYKIEETIRRLEQNPKLTCPNCGAITQVDATDLKAKLREAERMLERIPKKITIKL